MTRGSEEPRLQCHRAAAAVRYSSGRPAGDEKHVTSLGLHELTMHIFDVVTGISTSVTSHIPRKANRRKM